MWKTSLLVVALCFGCKAKAKEEPVVPAPTAGSAAPGSAVAGPAVACAHDTAELKIYLAAVFDPAMPKVEPPWPTQDAARDHAIEGLRADAREAMKRRDPAAKTKLLALGASPGQLEKELADCPPALAQLAAVSTAAPEQRVQTAVEIADAIAKCDCKADVKLVRALLYLGQRGPD